MHFKKLYFNSQFSMEVLSKTQN